jgi:hypothetical protein
MTRPGTMNKLFNQSLVLLPILGTALVSREASAGQMSMIDAAAVDAITPVTLAPSAGLEKNHFDLSFRSSFNISSRFKHVGSFAPQSNPGSATGLGNHTYDDGYNLLDGTGNQHFNGVDFTEGTWNWGYQSFNGQVNNNGDLNGTLSMHSDSATGDISGHNNRDPQPGFEMTFSRELYRGERYRWGFESAFNYTDVEIRDARGVNISVTRLTDTYSLMGNTVPTQDNYGQNVNGDPNHIIIGDVPTRSLSTVSMPVSGTREFGADLFGFKVGPYLEIPISKAVTFTFDAGITMVYVYSKLSFDETIVTDTGIVNVKGSGENQDLLFGGYFGGHVSLALNDRWTAFAGAQWQDVGTYSHRSHITRESAVLDLSQTIAVNFGLGFTF